MKEKIETQQIEFKTSWRDEYLKVVCAFANAEGGVLIVGLDDDGNPANLKKTRKLLEDIPNKIRNKLGIISSVEIEEKDSNDIVKIKVKPQSMPVSYSGRYYLRSGSNNFELKGNELVDFFLKKQGRGWDEIIEDRATFNDLNIETIKNFKRFARDRVPSISDEKDDNVVLEKLNLVEGNKLKRAAVLLFGKNPQRFYPSAQLKIGKFLTDTDLLTSDVVKGNLFEQLERALDILRTKYLISQIKFEGIHRRDILEYPYQALREAMLNAIIHRNYLGSSSIQIKIYHDRILLMNEGKLPPEVPVEKLKTDHLSKPRNIRLADTFYKAGFIEGWGRGTIEIVNRCVKQGLPEPDFIVENGVFQTILYKNIPELAEETAAKNVTENALKILEFISEDPLISMKELSQKTDLAAEKIEWIIERLKYDGYLRKTGPEKGGYWEILDSTELFRIPKSDLVDESKFNSRVKTRVKTKGKARVKTREKARVKTRGKTNRTREEIIRLIAENSTITVKELAEKIGLSTKTVEWNIKKLKDDDRLQRLGSAKSGYWKILDVEELFRMPNSERVEKTGFSTREKTRVKTRGKAREKTRVNARVKARGKTRVKTRVKTDRTREEIIRLIAENSSITVKELAKKIGLSTKTVEWNIKKLKKQGSLKRIGPPKGGQWVVLVE
jgi:ATP-dependent DNA helicase RecG